MSAFLKRLNVIAECRASRISVWSCPPFLFIVMGLVNIAAMVVSWLFATRYVDEPQMAALIVIAVAAVIFVIGSLIVHGFNQVAEANRIKSEFIAIVSHQLRSPLAIFKWTLETMQRASVPPGTERTSDPVGGKPRRDVGAAPPLARASNGANNPASGGLSHLEILRDSTEKMIQLVNMLLEVSRLEAGNIVLRRDPVRLEVLAEGIIRSFAAYARASNIAFDYAWPSALPPAAGDAEKLKMVIQNLVDNAIRYSSDGGRVAVTIAPYDSSSLEFKIHDTGVGISEREQRYVFQKFFRADHAMARQTQGSGLGLYIARAIILALGGKIGFESHEGKGSTFWFRLPIYKT